MLRPLLFGLVTFIMIVGCGSGNDKVVIPTEIKPAPGMDSEEKQKGVKPKPKPPDKKGDSSTDG